MSTTEEMESLRTQVRELASRLDRVEEVMPAHRPCVDAHEARLRLFWEEFSGRFAWDLLPVQFLYGLYGAWERSNGREAAITRTLFTQRLRRVLEGSEDWDFADPLRKRRRAGRMGGAEPLLEEYDTGWSDDGRANLKGPLRTGAADAAPSREETA